MIDLSLYLYVSSPARATLSQAQVALTSLEYPSRFIVGSCMMILISQLAECLTIIKGASLVCLSNLLCLESIRFLALHIYKHDYQNPA